MLYARWQRIRDTHAQEIALWHFAAPAPLTFLELDEMSRAVPISQNFLVARSGRVDFLPILIAGWRERVPVILVEGAGREPTAVNGAIPEGTAIVKQTCGAAGVERSLFFSESAILAEGERNVSGLGLHRGRRGLAALSMAHSYGFGCLALPLLLRGIPVEVLDAPFGPVMEAALNRGGPVFCPAVPALWKLWGQSGITARPEIDLAVSAGAPLRRELEKQIYDRDHLKVRNFYGTSETGAVAFDHSGELREKEELLGAVLDGVAVTINSEGHAVITTDALASGSDSLVHLTDWQSGSYTTQDRVTLEGKQLMFHGCDGDSINVAGRKVSQEKVKALLSCHSSVKALTISPQKSRDPERVQEVKCEVVLGAGETVSALKSFAVEHLESWEVPRIWSVLPEHSATSCR